MNPAYPQPYGSYMLLERLGQGGMSEVELARRAVDDAAYVRFLVIKRIHTRHTGNDGFVRMFQDEARINGELQHENIAQVYDFGQIGREYFLAMEYVPGLDLRQVQRRLRDRDEGFPIRITLRVLIDVLNALQYAHSRVDTYGRPMRIVHRDVNPRNVMLSVRGEVKLIDFGVAKADTRAEQTVGHSIKGKFAYMAPEQIDSVGSLDGRADVFAMGLVMHELISGRSPFVGLNEVQIMHRVLAGDIPPLQSTPGHPHPEMLQRVHALALATDREERFQSAQAMRDALEEAARPVGGPASSQEMAEFIRYVDPDAARALQDRLRTYREMDSAAVLHPPPANQDATVADPPSATPGPSEPGTIADPIPDHVPSPLDPDQADPNSSATFATYSGPKPDRRIAAVAIGALGGGMIAVAAVGALAWWALQLTTETPDPGTPPPTQATAAPDEVPPAAAQADVAPQPDPTAAPATRSPRPRPAADRPSGAGARRSTAPRRAAHVEAPPPEAAPTPTPPAPTPTPVPVEASDAPPPVESAPSPPPPETTDAGFLFVTSSPKGMSVLVNGQSVGTTPVRNHRLPVGSYSLQITGPDGQTWDRTADIQKGRSSFIKVTE